MLNLLPKVTSTLQAIDRRLPKYDSTMFNGVLTWLAAAAVAVIAGVLYVCATSPGLCGEV